jgi:hypothetical protein
MMADLVVLLIAAVLLLVLAGFAGYVLAHERLADARAALDAEWRALDNTRRVRAVFLHARRAMQAEAHRASRGGQFGHDPGDYRKRP